jgi:hypothetical protein
MVQEQEGEMIAAAVEATVVGLCNLFAPLLAKTPVTSPGMVALSNSVIDLSEEVVFDIVKWIQQNGRNYPAKPSDVPLELKAY